MTESAGPLGGVSGAESAVRGYGRGFGLVIANLVLVDWQGDELDMLQTISPDGAEGHREEEARERVQQCRDARAISLSRGSESSANEWGTSAPSPGAPQAPVAQIA